MVESDEPQDLAGAFRKFCRRNALIGHGKQPLRPRAQQGDATDEHGRKSG